MLNVLLEVVLVEEGLHAEVAVRVCEEDVADDLQKFLRRLVHLASRRAQHRLNGVFVSKVQFLIFTLDEKTFDDGVDQELKDLSETTGQA